MFTLVCHHCRQEFEVDESAAALLRGRSHFECPLCSQALPVSMIPRVAQPLSGRLNPCPPYSQGGEAGLGTPGQRSAPSPGPDGGAKRETWRGLNRNLLILGSAVILVLGGLGFYLATRPSGDSTELKQDITSEIIRNQYFSGLVAAGDASGDALEKIAHIEPHGPGFIGLSGEFLTWDQAREFAAEVGAELLSVESPTELRAPWNDPSTERLAEFLRLNFPEACGFATWIQQNRSPLPRVIDSPDVARVTTPDRPRRVFLRWWTNL